MVPVERALWFIESRLAEDLSLPQLTHTAPS